MLKRRTSCKQTLTFTPPDLFFCLTLSVGDKVAHRLNKKQQPLKTSLNCCFRFKAWKLLLSLDFFFFFFWVKRGQIPTNRPAESRVAPLSSLRFPEAAHLTDIGGGSQRAEAVSAPDSLFIYKLPALFSSSPPPPPLCMA